MAHLEFKDGGTLLFKKRSNAVKKPALMLSLMLMTSLLAGCASTGSTEIKAQCAAWRAITYSSKSDTAPTVKQIRVHNRTGQNLGCWK